VQVIPTSVTCTADNPANVRIYGYLNPTTLTTPTWTAVTGSAVESDVATTSYAGGTQICVFTASSDVHEMDHVFGLTRRALRQRALGGGSDVFLVGADSLGGTQNVTCSIEWQEVR
jgi:hypothetical protein